MKKICSVILFCLCLAGLGKMQAQDQDIKDYIDAYIGENAVPYLQPLADLFSSGLHTGVWDWPGMPDRIFVRVKLQGMMAYPVEDMRTFSGKTTGDFRPQQTVQVPTVIGDKSSVLITGEDNSIYIFPGGQDLKQIPLATPQISIGGLFNTELSGRFLSAEISDDIGRVRMSGFGVRHLISGWWQEPVLDFSIGYFYHHIEADTYLNSDQHLISAQLGKSGEILSGYVSGGYQISSTDVHYVYEDGTDQYPVSLTLENENRWLIEAGLGVRLGPVFATGSVSYAKHPSLAVGAGLFF